MRDDSSLLEHTASSFYEDVRREILPRLPELEGCRDSCDVDRHPAYRFIAPVVGRVLANPHMADFRGKAAPAKTRYRVVAWNIERGTQFDGQLNALRENPLLHDCDVLLLTEADAGMARSGNRMVAEELARELGMAQVFAPCYIALGKGSGVERDVDGANTHGLHGNAILSRYPLSSVKLIPLVNGVDKMRHREKRLGRQVAVAARIDFPNLALEAVSVHLDAQSTQRHRLEQMRAILAALAADGPVLLGGDWNTSTYNSSHAFWAIMGFWLRVFMGVENVIRNHYLHPERWFERKLFEQLEQAGFDFRRANALGEYTTYYDILDPRATRNLGEWVPGWCFAFIRWALRNHGGRCPLKLDWFAARGLKVENPVVVHELKSAHGAPLSDHDPIALDIVV